MDEIHPSSLNSTFINKCHPSLYIFIQDRYLKSCLKRFLKWWPYERFFELSPHTCEIKISQKNTYF